MPDGKKFTLGGKFAGDDNKPNEPMENKEKKAIAQYKKLVNKV